MPKMMDAETERQLIGIRKATAHARRMYEQGIISHDELNRVQTYALEQRMLKFLDVETYKAARENGDWDQFEHRARRLRYVHINVTCVASRTPSTRAAAGSSARSGAHSSFMATRPARRTHLSLVQTLATREFGQWERWSIVRILEQVAVRVGRAETIGRPWLWRLKTPAARSSAPPD
jgi:hypothetical protein